MTRAIAYGGVIVAILAGALALRVARLDHRPMHTDEAVHAVKFGTLLETGRYTYDHYEYHGPTLNYLTLPVAWLRGQSTFAALDETTLRLVPALAGTAAIAAICLLAAGLTWSATLAAAVLMALSPACLFYSRYYIQETLLILFTTLALGCAYQYLRRPRLVWALAAGAAIGLMHATKETFVLNLAAFVIAGFLVWFWRTPQQHSPSVSSHPHRKRIAPSHFLAAALAAVFVSMVFFSSFGANPTGILDSVRTYTTYLDRANETNIHTHPWYFYLHLLAAYHERSGPWWTEAFILALALIGVAAAITNRGLGRINLRLVRFLTFYAAALLLVYAAIPYKTPWCLLNFLYPLILLAGVGIAVLLKNIRKLPARIVIVALLLAGTTHLAWLTRLTSFRYAADERNPYVYAHTSTDLLRLAHRARQIAAVAPTGHDLLIKTIATPDNTWPLPWYLRRFRNTGFWPKPPADCDAAIVIADPQYASTVEARLTGQYLPEFFGLRPGVILRTYIRRDLWNEFIQNQQSRAIPAPRQEGQMTPPQPRDSLLAASESPAMPPLQRRAHEAMDTVWEILATEDTGEQFLIGASQEAWKRLDRLEDHLTRFREGSDVWQINRLAAGQSVPVAPDVLDCLQAAQEISRHTYGAFDITVTPLLELWKSSRQAGQTPTQDQIDAALLQTGADLLALDPEHRAVGICTNGVRIDLGGIGKGFALDRLAEILADWQIDSALLHGGYSTVLALDPPPGRTGWPLTLRRPDRPDDILARVDLAHAALAASGTAARGHHILNPRTGRPVTDRLRAWALAPDATTADALSTACMVMSPAEIEDYCRQHPSAGALILPADPAQPPLRFGRLAAK